MTQSCLHSNDGSVKNISFNIHFFSFASFLPENTIIPNITTKVKLTKILRKRVLRNLTRLQSTPMDCSFEVVAYCHCGADVKRPSLL